MNSFNIHTLKNSEEPKNNIFHSSIITQKSFFTDFFGSKTPQSTIQDDTSNL